MFKVLNFNKQNYKFINLFDIDDKKTLMNYLEESQGYLNSTYPESVF